MQKKTTTERSVEKIRFSGTWWVELDMDCLSELDRILTDIREYGDVNVLSIEPVHTDGEV